MCVLILLYRVHFSIVVLYMCNVSRAILFQGGHHSHGLGGGGHDHDHGSHEDHGSHGAHDELSESCVRVVLKLLQIVVIC